MGVSYSTENHSLVSAEHFAYLDTSRSTVRYSARYASLFVAAYSDYMFQPIVNFEQLHSFIYLALKAKSSDESHLDLVNAIWFLFAVDTSCLVIECMVIFVLLSPDPWPIRCGLIFDIFKSIGAETLGYDEVSFAAQSTMFALCRFWRCPPWKNEALFPLCEELADDAFTKTGKSIDEDMLRTEFVTWMVGRFKESRIVLTSDALLAIYTSPFVDVTGEVEEDKFDDI